MESVRSEREGIFGHELASSYRFQNFDPIARPESVGRKRGPRNHVAIDSDRDTTLLEPEFADQPLHRAVAVNGTGGAIDEQIDA
jgi:hypothetical protein